MAARDEQQRVEGAEEQGKVKGLRCGGLVVGMSARDAFDGVPWLVADGVWRRSGGKEVGEHAAPSASLDAFSANASC